MGGRFSKLTFVSDPSQYATRIESEDSSELKWKEFDYIVVGGGESVLFIPYIPLIMWVPILVFYTFRHRWLYSCFPSV